MKDSMRQYILRQFEEGNSIDLRDLAEMFDRPRNVCQTAVCMLREKIETDTRLSLICFNGVYSLTQKNKEEQKLEMDKRKKGTITKIKGLGRIIVTTARLFPRLIPEIEESMLEVSQHMYAIRLKQLRKQMKQLKGKK